ncbi:hypothetical protein HD554DRAFT_2030111 [Boletus coccyginus]|nr:hypothetical protein HD554DRAFT_2030111 [Boletus coccyginus]
MSFVWNTYCRLIFTNPDIYPDPDMFNLERFLGKNQQLDPHEICFRWGRWLCPGSLLAELMIFICVVMVLATLDILRCTENGVEVVPMYDNQLCNHVKPFKCEIVLQSKRAVEFLHIEIVRFHYDNLILVWVALHDY